MKLLQDCIKTRSVSQVNLILFTPFVLLILADLEMDKETIAAGLLHDVVEDTVMTKDEVEKEFGKEVALLVDGVTKLTRLSYDTDKIEVQAENLRKMFCDGQRYSGNYY